MINEDEVKFIIFQMRKLCLSVSVCDIGCMGCCFENSSSNYLYVCVCMVFGED